MKKYIKEILFAILLLVYLIGAYWYYTNKIEFNYTTIAVASLSIITIVFYILELKKRVQDISNDSKLEDEFSLKVKIYAGYYAFIASFFLWSTIFIIVNFNHMNIKGNIDGLFGLGLFGSVVIYYLSYYYLKTTGNFHEK